MVANSPLRKRTTIADRRSADSPKKSPQSVLAAKPMRRTGLRPNRSDRMLDSIQCMKEGEEQGGGSRGEGKREGGGRGEDLG